MHGPGGTRGGRALAGSRRPGARVRAGTDRGACVAGGQAAPLHALAGCRTGATWCHAIRWCHLPALTSAGHASRPGRLEPLCAVRGHVAQRGSFRQSPFGISHGIQEPDFSPSARIRGQIGYFRICRDGPINRPSIASFPGFLAYFSLRLLKVTSPSTSSASFGGVPGFLEDSTSMSTATLILRRPFPSRFGARTPQGYPDGIFGQFLR